jgi:NADH dehydrogenase FAD-containing subunit
MGGYYIGPPLCPLHLLQATFLIVPCTETGASQLIIDGKIKLKSGPKIKNFTEHTIQFDDGSELEADVVVFATGCAGSLHPFPST